MSDFAKATEMSIHLHCKQCGLDKLRLVNGLCAICAAELKGHNDSTTATGIEAEVCRDIAERQKLGKNKYGQTLADNHAGLYERVNHAYEEALDLAVYLRWSLERIKEMDEQHDYVRESLGLQRKKMDLDSEFAKKTIWVELEKLKCTQAP